ncbi:SNF2-related protein, partial [Pseudomonas aeruginosa]
MAKRLQGNLDKAAEVIDLTQTLDEDYEGLDELADESERELESEEVEILTAGERDTIAAEIAELQQFKNMATSIRENGKGKALLIALDRAFAELERLGAARKA